MKVLVKINNSPEQRFLVELTTKELIREVKNLVNKSKYSKAAVTALSKGKFLREISSDELPYIETDLILTNNQAHHDLT